MAELTITGDGSTGELLAHVAELQRKAIKLDALREDLQKLVRDLRDYAGQDMAAYERHPDGFWKGKASGYSLAAQWIADLV